MEVVYRCCCGIDVHKNLIVACLRKGGRQELQEFGTMTSEIKALANWLTEAGCAMAAMESTGPYWKPLYNLFELLGLDTMIVNAAHMKAVLGRKTDSKDSEWIAEFQPAIAEVCQMPGIARRSAEVILAETGIDMSRFPSAGICAPGREFAQATTRVPESGITARRARGIRR